MFCPFINGDCRKDCTFHCHKVAGTELSGITECLIASKLDSVNDTQTDQLSEIIRLLSESK